MLAIKVRSIIRRLKGNAAGQSSKLKRKSVWRRGYDGDREGARQGWTALGRVQRRCGAVVSSVQSREGRAAWNEKPRGCGASCY